MFCNRTKEFLRQHNVAFTDRDITTDETALAELEKLGVMTTPVVVVDGQTVIGYDTKRLAALLGLPTG
jgi:glutaredoxin